MENKIKELNNNLNNLNNNYKSQIKLLGQLHKNSETQKKINKRK